MDEESFDHMDEVGIPMLVSGYNIIITMGSKKRDLSYTWPQILNEEESQYMDEAGIPMFVSRYINITVRPKKRDL